MRMPFFSEFNRRDWMNISLASALGLSYSGWLKSLAAAVETSGKKPIRSCILLWMNGGPSQIDTFDPKPEDKNGGEFLPIDTAVPGIQISEHLPGVAREMKDLAVIRSMTTREGDHGRATFLMKTGYRKQGAVRYPSLGSLVARELGKAEHDLPNFVSVSPFRFGAGAGFLGPQYAPLTVSGASNDPQTRANLAVENLEAPSSVSAESVQHRFDVLQVLQSDFSSRFGGDSARAHRANYERAIRMVKTRARSAFKLEDEPPALREAYGRNRFGQGCLLARRLVERDVPFIEVALGNLPGNNATWDSHNDNFTMVRRLCEVLDPAWSTLMRDLRDRGLLETTLVVWMGEFGRTPRIVPDRTGRDHFPAAWSTVLGGAGIRGGQVIGDTGKDGTEIQNRPVRVNEYFGTICAALGIDHAKQNISPAGRPIAIVEDGKVMPELMSPSPI